jgi:hypothetical protein
MYIGLEVGQPDYRAEYLAQTEMHEPLPLLNVRTPPRLIKAKLSSVPAQ